MITSKRIDAALDRDPDGPMTIRERITVGVVLTGVLAVGLWVAELRLPDGPDPAPASSLQCSSEDEVLLEVQADAFGYSADQLVCVHIDALTPSDEPRSVET